MNQDLQDVHPTEINNIKVQDKYFWMRDKSWPKKISNPQISELIEKENKNFEHFIKQLSNVKENFYKEIKSRIKLTDKSVYIKKDNYYYYSRTEEEKNYPIYCRSKDKEGVFEEILLDINKISENHSFCNIGNISVSNDHKLLIYSVDFTGDEKYEAFILDIEKQTILNDKVSNVIGNLVWDQNIQGFFYTAVEKNWKHLKVFYHELGTQSKNDKLIFQEKNDLYFVNISKSSDKNFLLINVAGHENNEIFFIDLRAANPIPTLIKKRSSNIFYDLDSCIDFFYMKINHKNSKNFYIVKSSNKNYDYNVDSWEIFIPYYKNKHLVSFDISKDYLLLNYKYKSTPLIYIQDFNTGEKKQIHFEEESFEASAYSTNFFENDIRIQFSSLKSPEKIFSYDYKNHNLSLLKVKEIPSGFNSNEYEVKKIFTKIDNNEIPVTIFYKKSLLKDDGSNYLYLNGYGAYGISNSCSFRNSAISIANMGIIYCIAHIRGGSEMGYQWYLDGKFLNKKNSFKDFIAVTEDLIRLKYSKINKILISGGSAGGMLIGNVINQKPNYYKAAILHVPFVDVLNTMLDETLPLTTNEFKEWGNPKEKEYFHYIKSYCPYQNIKNQDYPHIYATTGVSDIRVGYWEVLKWLNKIKEKRSNNNLLLLKTNMDSGHGGQSKRFEYLKDIAEELSFIKKITEN
ncbi:MAG: S9 family peptidase [Rickettsia sp.]|nr:S9 family peptidase [Rickettsia sp.]